jgi:hypothetical protein
MPLPTQLKIPGTVAAVQRTRWHQWKIRRHGALDRGYKRRNSRRAPCCRMGDPLMR